MIKNIFFILTLAAFCIGCATEETTVEREEKTLEQAREEALAEIDQEACVAKGGVVRPEGMLGFPRCVLPYSDAGKVCSDSAQCEGKCLSQDGVTDYDAPSGEAKGLCEADDSPFGCYAELEDGSVGPALCVD